MSRRILRLRHVNAPPSEAASLKIPPAYLNHGASHVVSIAYFSMACATVSTLIA